MFGDRNLNQLLVWVACEASFEAGLPPRGRSGERQVRVFPFNEWHVSIAFYNPLCLCNGLQKQVGGKLHSFDREKKQQGLE